MHLLSVSVSDVVESSRRALFVISSTLVLRSGDGEEGSPNLSFVGKAPGLRGRGDVSWVISDSLLLMSCPELDDTADSCNDGQVSHISVGIIIISSTNSSYKFQINIFSIFGKENTSTKLYSSWNDFFLFRYSPPHERSLRYSSRITMATTKKSRVAIFPTVC